MMHLMESIEERLMEGPMGKEKEGILNKDHDDELRDHGR